MSEQEMRVLIIEDREDHAVLIRALVEEGLSDAQPKVSHAATGLEGLHCLESDHYDICLLDHQLGEDIDGVAVLGTAQAKGIKTPIVILTSMGDEAIAVQAMKAGAKDYLRKEMLSPELLRSTIHHALALHREEMLREQAQEALQRAKDELETKVWELSEANKHLLRLSRLKDEFVSSISHELRTPITNIKLAQQLLIAHPAAQDKYLATLRREAERLHFIIEDLLDVARMALEPPTLNLVTCDVNTLALLYVADRTFVAEGRGLSLTFSGESDLPKVRVDQMRIERVLGILVINALNYTPNGGQVEVSTRSQLFEGVPWVALSVKDTGPGISLDEQERLFEQFFRGKAARERGVAGTGLGLFIAKGIIEKHGGRVEVSSEGVAGRGTKFTVWLRALEQEEGKRRPKLAERLRPKKDRELESAA